MNLKLQTKTPWGLVFCVAAVLVAGPPTAHAQIVTTAPTNSIQTVPDTASATLLIPYFEVNLSSPTGMNTVFTINNAGAVNFFSINGGTPIANQNGPTAILAHVTIWSDLGVPVFNFNVYLTGFDVETIDLRQILTTGNLPQTASAGQDPGDTISPKGRDSQDINFASCNPPNPLHPLPFDSQLPPSPLTGAQMSSLQALLTGNASAAQGGQCAGLNHGDNVARGYITVDTVNNCTTRNPGDAGYFPTSLQNGDITNQSFQLNGEVFYQDQDHAIFRGGNAVHIHASGSDPLVTTSGNYTFYGRLDNFTAVDNRQPLATNFAARYSSGTSAGSLIVWRDPKVPQGYFTCGVLPTWYQLGQEGITAFDEQEHPQFISAVKPFPAATQIVPIGGTALPVSFAAGWLYLDLNFTGTGTPAPPVDPAAAQAWVDVVDGKFGTQHRAQQLDSGTQANHSFPGSKQP